MRAGDGNEADKAVFGQILVELKKPINLDSILVCDSALYSQENLQLIKLLKWISRVPMTIKKAQELGRTVEIEEIDAKEISRRADLGLEGYNWKESRVNYGGIEQIWLVVESKKKLKKEGIKLEKLLKKLKREEFDNPQQARYKLKGINITIKLFKIEESKIIEGQSKKKELIYKIEGVLQPQVEEIAIGRKEAGRFILATKWLKID